jgi:hypothetical protein
MRETEHHVNWQIRDFWLLPLIEIESNNDLLLIGSRNLGGHVADRGHADAVMISNAILFMDLLGVPNAAHMAKTGFVQSSAQSLNREFNPERTASRDRYK